MEKISKKIRMKDKGVGGGGKRREKEAKFDYIGNGIFMDREKKVL